ncbi:MAG: hypothetical protein ACLTDR_15365 [Adlercreutzia equolifaciens]
MPPGPRLGGRERPAPRHRGRSCSEIAKAQAAEIYHGQRALVVSGEGWHEGVKGIVASRLVNTYGGAGAAVHHRRRRGARLRTLPWANVNLF